ncbi:hypothetical protein JG687_00006675 [Phytophthora cactorum]|uniref:Uncharacterized protein n=1 Tax=Phytophthora cactorum TaxID=29920 RepID=A0A329SC05_9STRA|nr:hypothetical protein Pcac1_g23918 [Phytophthora cactorum]KAG2847091.1 hypothetical protein PC111_g910 [Phytophthora cactorum]KAG2847882.1 hypothetical protein PC112_g893 [Phytophthora cactorum]KAG2867090.1 hypothetical protein PC113_g2278 [Phytophthora cactorum]KAG2933432.1 hypothetical protein PC114_g1420 [Phytophthora cactorum]
MRRGMKPTQAMGLKRKRGVSCRLTSPVLLIGAHLCLRLDTIASEERHLAPLTGKAQKWAEVPGVRFILCVAVTRNLATAEYKLYTVGNQNDERPELDLYPSSPRRW